MTATPLPIAPRSASGFLKPVFSALQRRALRASILFGSVFLIGLVAICWQIYHLIPEVILHDVFAVDGVVVALIDRLPLDYARARGNGRGCTDIRPETRQ